MKPVKYCICGRECLYDGKGGYMKTCGNRRCRGLLTKQVLPKDHFKTIGQLGGRQRQ